MKTNIYFWSYLAQFFLEWEMLQKKIVQKMRKHTFMSNNSPQPLYIVPFVR